MAEAALHELRRCVFLGIYLILAILLNFLVDFLLLMGSGRLLSDRVSPLGCALGAAVGAVCSGACFVPGLSFLRAIPWQAARLALMGAAAFGLRREAVKETAVFLLLNMALGGAARIAGRGDLLGLALGAGGIWLLRRGGSGGGRYVPVRLTYGGRTERVLALRDTGNTLRDPVTGEQVLIVSGKTARKLTGLTQSQLSSPLDTLARRPLPGLRLIPYRTVGNGHGMLLGMRLERVEIGGRARRMVVAFDPEGLEAEGMALIGGMV